MRATIYSVTAATVLLLLFSGAVAPPAAACGFDGLLGDGFSAEHPKSISVAFAISDAVATGSVDRAAISPIVPGSQGYWRAVGRINALQRLLPVRNVADAAAPSISLLFIDSKLWTRYIPGRNGYELQVHASGPSPDDVVIVTSETILATLLDGKMDARKAIDLGVVAIDGSRDGVEAVQESMIIAMERTRADVVARSTVAPIRLFGSAR